MDPSACGAFQKDKVTFEEPFRHETPKATNIDDVGKQKDRTRVIPHGKATITEQDPENT